jgi:nucleoside-diphosphate-sugar epimerase
MKKIPHGLLVCGLGYVGSAVVRAAVAAGFDVVAISRDPAGRAAPQGVELIQFADAGPAIQAATHLLATAPPDAEGDPLLAHHAAAIGAAASLRWIGYLSTTGVYGDHGGGWVDEDTPPAPASDRTRRRVAAEAAWSGFADRIGVDIFRIAGIYGPGRSAFDDLRAGQARLVIKPGHAFGRIHRDDIARAVLAAMQQDRDHGTRILNLADDEPAESALVIEEAARLLGIAPPPAVAFADAWEQMSPMARGFWSENRRVANTKTKAALGISWLYPSYREGLRAILGGEIEAGEGPAQ